LGHTNHRARDVETYGIPRRVLYMSGHLSNA